MRSPEEFGGLVGYGCDPRQGHLPGARNVPVGELLERPAEELQTLLGTPTGSEIVVYCHSGARSRAAANALGAAGYEARNYVGSWHEWSRRGDLPTRS